MGEGANKVHFGRGASGGWTMENLCHFCWKVGEFAPQRTLRHTYVFVRMKIQPLGHDITDKHSSTTNFLKITGSFRDPSGSFHQ